MTTNNKDKNNNIDIYIYRLEISSEINSEDDSNSITYLGQTLSLSERLNNHITGNGKSSKIIHSITQPTKKEDKNSNKSKIYKVSKLKNLYKITISNDILSDEAVKNEKSKDYISLIDSIRTNFENIVYDSLKKGIRDFWAYNTFNFFNGLKERDSINDIKIRFKILNHFELINKKQTKSKLEQRLKKLTNKLKESSLVNSEKNYDSIIQTKISEKENIASETESMDSETEDNKKNVETYKLLFIICKELSNENKEHKVEFTCRYLDNPVDIDDTFKANLLKDSNLIKDCDDDKIEFR